MISDIYKTFDENEYRQRVTEVSRNLGKWKKYIYINCHYFRFYINIFIYIILSEIAFIIIEIKTAEFHEESQKLDQEIEKLEKELELLTTKEVIINFPFI